MPLLVLEIELTLLLSVIVVFFLSQCWVWGSEVYL